MKYWLAFILFYLCAKYSDLNAQSLFFDRISGLTDHPNTSIYGISKDSLGYMWFGSWNGVYRYNGKDFKHFINEPNNPYSLRSNRIRNVITDDHQQVWILGYDHSCMRFNYRLHRFEEIDNATVPPDVLYLLNSSSNTINREKQIDGVRYLISNHHFTAVNRREGSTKTFLEDMHQPGKLRDADITSFYIDDHQLIWLGTRSGKIYCANPNRPAFLLQRAIIASDSTQQVDGIRTLTKYQNHLWLGTNNGPLITGGNNLSVVKNSGVELQKARSLLVDEQHILWVGTVDGLYRYQNNPARFVPFFTRQTHSEIPIFSVHALANGDNNTIWVGLHNAIAKVNLTNGIFKRYDLTHLLNNQSVMALSVAKDGSIWAGTEGSGVLHISLNEDGELSNVQVIQSQTNALFRGDLVYSIYVDSLQRIWCGTTDGVYVISDAGKVLVHLNTSKGIKDNYITAITALDDSTVWLAHKKGLQRVNAQTFETEFYPIMDDNQNWVFLDGSVFADYEQQTLYFGATEGYVSFQPDKIQSDTVLPLLRFNTLEVLNQMVKPNSKLLNGALSLTHSLVFPYASRTFSIQMDGLHFTSVDDCSFMYMLDGYDEDWISSTNDIVSYAKVRPGHYTFKAKAIASNGLESEVNTLNIHIKQPWYAQWWAFSLYLLILVISVRWIYKQYQMRTQLKNQVLKERFDAEKKEELHRERMEFFTNVSHELKTPLSLIATPLEQLQQKYLNEESKSVYMDLMNRNVKVLSNLIHQMLSFRKMEEGKLQVNPVAMNAMETIQKAFDDFKLLAVKRGFEYRLLGNKTAIHGYFDSEKLNQILQNLISNAFKYTPDQGKVSVNVEVIDNQKLQIVVSDNGMGMNKETLNKIFEPFNTVGSQPFYGQSSGMGLAYTQKLVALLNGHLDLESQLNKGTQVRLIIPFVPVMREGSTSEQIDKDVPKSSFTFASDTGTDTPILLVVEDNRDMQTLLKTELSSSYRVLSANDGLEGLRLAQEHIPDVVISDVMMPGMDGMTLCAELKTNEKTSHIPVLLLTAKSTKQDKVKGLENGADVYLEKPFEVDILKAQLQTIIENRKLLRKQMSESGNYGNSILQQNPADARFMKKAVAVVEKFIDDPSFNGSRFAEALNVSERQLYRKLKATTECTVQEFIVQLRMEKAVELILNSSFTFTQIAYKVGFTEPSNFSRTFKKQYGCTPSQYKKSKK